MTKDTAYYPDAKFDVLAGARKSASNPTKHLICLITSDTNLKDLKNTINDQDLAITSAQL
jgi:hypothetical protein